LLGIPSSTQAAAKSFGSPPRDHAPAFHVDDDLSVLNAQAICFFVCGCKDVRISRVSLIASYHVVRKEDEGLKGRRACAEENTSHIFFSFIDDEGIAFVWFLGFRSCLIFDNPDPLDWAESAEFTFEVGFFHLVAEPSNEQRLDSITFDFGVFIRSVGLEIWLLYLCLA
jgi:hypothetical protein